MIWELWRLCLGSRSEVLFGVSIARCRGSGFKGLAVSSGHVFLEVRFRGRAVRLSFAINLNPQDVEDPSKEVLMCSHLEESRPISTQRPS